MKVCIDPGHGKIDPGAIGRDPFLLMEKDVNLAIALELERSLENADTCMTRRMDRTLSLRARADFANRHEADVFVSIHCNAAANNRAEGMEVFHFPGSWRGESFAWKVLDEMLLIDPFGHKDRDTKSANFAVLRLTGMPAILLECEFLTNPKQLEWLSLPETHAELGEAIARGLLA